MAFFTLASRPAGGLPGAPHVGAKTPAPPSPQPLAAGRTVPCLWGEFSLGFRACSFPFLPQKGRKREVLGGAWLPGLPFRRLLRPGCCGAGRPRRWEPAVSLCPRGGLPNNAACIPWARLRAEALVFGMAVDWLGFGYAALVASGGIIGYAKAGSVPSLAAGLFFGSLAGLGAYQVSQNPNNIWVSLITSGALTAVMGTRFYHSRKFMPAGLIAGVSLLMVGRLALKMLEKPQEK
uniref:Transmembrane protein 14C n=36 Tax=Passeriformes TaxID=9126 RepID=A0A8C5NSD8_JUNHY